MTEYEASFSQLVVEEHNEVLVMTMNRPQVRNAMSLSLATEIAAAIDILDERPDLRVGVLTGAGGTFCAGMDLKAFARGERPDVPGRGFGGLVERPPTKPLVAAIEGYALGGGFELALACDLLVASRTATFGLPEVTRGLAAASGGLLRLPQRVPYYLAMEVLLTGRMWPAIEADAAGLINRLVEPGEALAVAMELAKQIAANAPLAVAATKQVLVEAGNWRADEAFSEQAKIVARVRASADAIEGARAFSEKRTPVWTGT